MTDAPGQFSWLLSLLDIVLVSVVIYHFLLLLKGGGVALHLLFWLTIGCIVFLGARFTGLETLGWLLNAVLSASLLIVAIIFQHDIRRALLNFSRQRQRLSGLNEDTGELIDELLTAVESLSQKQIGALIVIERGMPLDSFLAVGTVIDAKVTSELISSIFLPYSPIHDGAVIIQGDKLTRAGCFLPLTENPEIGKHFGTRHRAAIGLTEVVDALVVVVSEETGRIALVCSGKILENLEIPFLRKELKRQLSGGRKR
ncbi:MAG: TIGR00159 family protein [Geobacter sp.]|nr:TIGR00159 family protein [Geobacter sp.]